MRGTARLRLLMIVALSVAFAAQPVDAAWTPRPGAAPALPTPAGGGKFARSALPAPRVVDVRTIAKRAPTRARGSKTWLNAPTVPSPARGGGKPLAASGATSGPKALEAATSFEGL